jgi:WhiB family transcriptional regulator, redox-sensing transcriptional regulator
MSTHRRSRPWTEPPAELNLPEPPPWMGGAACAEVDPDVWFPGKGGSNVEAKAICQGCDVRAECLAWALEQDMAYGVFGGLTRQERLALRTGGAS